MSWLLFSILLSTLLFIGFKWFDIKKINLLMAITGNYISCIVTGLLMRNIDHAGAVTTYQAYDNCTVATCLAMGMLFFAVFYAMGYASARIGVGITGASTKMSLVIPVLYGMIALGEKLWLHHILGLVFALLAILLMSVNPGETLPLKKLLLPLFIFIGSGLVDLSINLLRMTLDTHHFDHGTSIILIFSGALGSALILLLCRYRYLFRDLRSLAYGCLLGIPNYFSIYAMVKALGSGEFRSNDFYMVNNTGIVVLCFVSGLLLFGEKLNWAKGAGLILSVLSVCLILGSNAFF